MRKTIPGTRIIYYVPSSPQKAISELRNAPLLSARPSIFIGQEACSARKNQFELELKSALDQFDVSTPPDLHILLNPDGYTLDTRDERNANFQAMLLINPKLEDYFDVVINDDALLRESALAKAMDVFAKNRRDFSISIFLEAFEREEHPKAFRIRFDGKHATVQEKERDQWRATKNATSFFRHLTAAYARYCSADIQTR